MMNPRSLKQPSQPPSSNGDNSRVRCPSKGSTVRWAEKRELKWDNTITDLSRYKLSEDMELRRRMNRISKHKDHAAAECRERLEEMRTNVRKFLPCATQDYNEDASHGNTGDKMRGRNKDGKVAPSCAFASKVPTGRQPEKAAKTSKEEMLAARANKRRKSIERQQQLSSLRNVTACLAELDRLPDNLSYDYDGPDNDTAVGDFKEVEENIMNLRSALNLLHNTPSYSTRPDTSMLEEEEEFSNYADLSTTVELQEEEEERKENPFGSSGRGKKLSEGRAYDGIWASIDGTRSNHGSEQHASLRWTGGMMVTDNNSDRVNSSFLVYAQQTSYGLTPDAHNGSRFAAGAGSADDHDDACAPPKSAGLHASSSALSSKTDSVGDETMWDGVDDEFLSALTARCSNGMRVTSHDSHANADDAYNDDEEREQGNVPKTMHTTSSLYSSRHENVCRVPLQDRQDKNENTSAPITTNHVRVRPPASAAYPVLNSSSRAPAKGTENENQWCTHTHAAKGAPSREKKHKGGRPSLQSESTAVWSSRVNDEEESYGNPSTPSFGGPWSEAAPIEEEEGIVDLDKWFPSSSVRRSPTTTPTKSLSSADEEDGEPAGTYTSDAVPALQPIQPKPIERALKTLHHHSSSSSHRKEDGKQGRPFTNTTSDVLSGPLSKLIEDQCMEMHRIFGTLKKDG